MNITASGPAGIVVAIFWVLFMLGLVSLPILFGGCPDLMDAIMFQMTDGKAVWSCD